MLGRGGCADAGNVLHRGGSGGAPLRVRVVVHIPTDWEGSGRLSPSGDTATEKEDATEERGRDLDIPSPG